MRNLYSYFILGNITIDGFIEPVELPENIQRCVTVVHRACGYNFPRRILL